MKAAYLTGHGGTDKFVYGDLPDPVAGPGEVVVDVHAASVNAADYKVRLGGGAYSGASPLKFPYILGRDFSGDLRRVRGAWRVEPSDDGSSSSRVTYSAYVDVGRFVPTALVRDVAMRKMNEMVTRVRAVAADLHAAGRAS